MENQSNFGESPIKKLITIYQQEQRMLEALMLTPSQVEVTPESLRRAADTSLVDNIRRIKG